MRTLIAIVCLASISACASYSGTGLEPGKSTGQDVEAVMGKPAAVREMPNGETVLWYPRLPYGGQSFAARIGADGRLIAIEQRLADEYISRIKPNVSSADDVLDLIGPPYRSYPLERMQREAWEYQLLPQPVPFILYVQLSPDHIVREVFQIQDPASLRDRRGFGFGFGFGM
jgi:hypothetical protein